MKIDRYEVIKKLEKSFSKLRRGEQDRVKAALAAAGEDLRILCRLYGEGEVVGLLLVVGTHSHLHLYK